MSGTFSSDFRTESTRRVSPLRSKSLLASSTTLPKGVRGIIFGRYHKQHLLADLIERNVPSFDSRHPMSVVRDGRTRARVFAHGRLATRARVFGRAMICSPRTHICARKNVHPAYAYLRAKAYEHRSPFMGWRKPSPFVPLVGGPRGRRLRGEPLPPLLHPTVRDGRVREFTAFETPPYKERGRVHARSSSQVLANSRLATGSVHSSLSGAKAWELR